VHLRLPGRHNVLNALAAFAVGREAGVEVSDAVAAIERLRPSEKRGDVIAWRGAEIVNDTYNSNPQALLSMIAALRNTPAERRILVAGEMLELGDEGPALHAACGAAAAEAGVDVVVGVRGLALELVAAARAGGVEAVFVETAQEAGAWLRENLRAGDVALLKASRGVRLEQALGLLLG
jgi:UDP-N-acetylmuramoyl-tripeptide--D-alanyl-D-alanine ligase